MTPRPFGVAAVVLSIAAANPARAQAYRFPASDSDYGNFYVTAYKDEGGTDWNCGDIYYSGHDGSDFGVGSWSGMDAGQDLVAAADGSVVATNDGEYDRCDTGDCEGGGGFGNYVKLAHSDGTVTYYGHMKQWSVAVSTGDAVSCGQKLGEVGSSGYSTGPHVHFEPRNSSNVALDPFDGDCSSGPSLWVDQGAYDGLPSVICETVEPCAPAGTLSCGDAVSTSNNGSGSTASHGWYGCTDFTYSGAEIAWWVTTDLDETIAVSVTGLGADLDLFSMSSDTCNGSDCITASTNPDASDESISWSGSAGASYLVVVDGWEGATSAFTLTVSCNGGRPGEEEDDTGASNPVDTSDTSPAIDSGEEGGNEGGGPRGGEPPGSAVRFDEVGGCGCGASSGSPTLAFGVSALALRRRRARR